MDTGPSIWDNLENVTLERRAPTVASYAGQGVIGWGFVEKYEDRSVKSHLIIRHADGDYDTACHHKVDRNALTLSNDTPPSWDRCRACQRILDAGVDMPSPFGHITASREITRVGSSYLGGVITSIEGDEATIAYANGATIKVAWDESQHKRDQKGDESDPRYRPGEFVPKTHLDQVSPDDPEAPEDNALLEAPGDTSSGDGPAPDQAPGEPQDLPGEEAPAGESEGAPGVAETESGAPVEAPVQATPDTGGFKTDASGVMLPPTRHAPVDFDAKNRFNALSMAERDSLADATNSIPARVAEIVPPRQAVYSPDVVEAVDQRMDEVKTVMAPKIAQMVRQHVHHLGNLLQAANPSADPAAIQDLLLDACDYLAAQDAEAQGRVLGDHGARHLLTDARVASQVMKLAGDGSPATEAEMYLCGIFHDAGYMTPPGRQFLDSDHPRWSRQNYKVNLQGKVASILGPEAAEEMAKIIVSHDKTEMDWSPEESRASAFRLADNLGLFHSDKLPDICYLVHDNVDVLVRLAQGDLDAEGARTEMKANINQADLPPLVKQNLYAAADEVGPALPKFVLGMVGTKLGKIEWAGDHPVVHLQRTEANEALSKVLDMGQRQFLKFAETYVGEEDATKFLEKEHFQFKNRRGHLVLESHLDNPLTPDEIKAVAVSIRTQSGWLFDTLTQPFVDRYKPIEGRDPSFDWCRFRHNSHCFLPKTLDVKATEQVGYDVWVPEDRGYCPRIKWDAQKACPVSEAGPNSGDPNAKVETWQSFEQGGQRGYASLHRTASVGFPVEDVEQVGGESSWHRGIWTGVVAADEGAYSSIGYRGMGSIDEIREALGSGSWQSNKSFTLEFEGRTQFTTDPDEAARFPGATVVVEVELSGLPFKTIVPPVESGDITYVPANTGEGLGIEGSIQARRILRIGRVQNGSVVEWMEPYDLLDPEADAWGSLESRSASLQAMTASFEFQSTWADVRAKAKRIKDAGGVKIIAADGDLVSAHVQGDHGQYLTSIQRVPGTKQIAMWECGCPWSTYSWGRSGRWKKYEGRMCSHAQALVYEVQAQEMFGGEVAYGDPNPVTYPTPMKQPGAWRLDGSEPRPDDDDPFDFAASLRPATTYPFFAFPPKVATRGFLVRWRDSIHLVTDILDNMLRLDTGEEVSPLDVTHPGYDPVLGLTASKTGTSFDYRMQHQPLGPGDDVGACITNMDQCFPADVYDHPEWYSASGQYAEIKAILNRARNNPSAMIDIYRAVPPGVTSIENGNWVAIIEDYARGHAMQDDDPANDWPVLKATVPASTIWTGGDDLNEWGYWGPDITARTASLHTALAELSGCMVALVPPRGLCEQLAIEGGEPVEHMHITLAYMGKAADVDLDAVHAAVAEWAGRTPRLAGEVSGFGTFQNGKEPVLWTGFDVPGLERFREDLVDTLCRHGVVPANNHGFQIHMTLAYGETVMPTSDANFDPFLFESAIVAEGNQWTYYPLSGNPVEPTMSETIEVDAALFEGAYLTIDEARAAGAEAMLHDEPEPALPRTDGADEDPALLEGGGVTRSAATVRRAHPGGDGGGPKQGHLATDPDSRSWLMDGGGQGNSDIAAQAQAFLSKSAVRQFSPVEQAQIIAEGEHTEARNLDRLSLEGTHYIGSDGAESDDDLLSWL